MPAWPNTHRAPEQDFKGQMNCERTFQILVILFGLIGFVLGYLQQDFRLTFYWLASGGSISAVVRSPRQHSRRWLLRTVPSPASSHPTQICLPDWPWWNRHPLEWLEVQEEEAGEGGKEKKKKKNKDKEKDKEKVKSK